MANMGMRTRVGLWISKDLGLGLGFRVIYRQNSMGRIDHG